MMRTINDTLLDELMAEAIQSPRGRAHYNFHQPEDLVQRMINVLTRGTYVPVHKHHDPDKVEHFAVIKGSAACVQHDEGGKVKDYAVLSPSGPNYTIDILPNTYHTFVCLSKLAVMLEIVEGPYDPKTHKKIADFAPAEGSDKAVAFVTDLEEMITTVEKLKYDS